MAKGLANLISQSTCNSVATLSLLEFVTIVEFLFPHFPQFEHLSNALATCAPLCIALYESGVADVCISWHVLEFLDSTIVEFLFPRFPQFVGGAFK